jgi:P2 family phage contractile tail tube protein
MTDKHNVDASDAGGKLAIDGEELIEIDAINLVRKVGGVDQMARIRQAIGV